MSGLAKPIATFVGSRSDAHPSFMQAYLAGVLLDWVRDAAELKRRMLTGKVTDLVIFDTRYQSEDQCAFCRALLAAGHRVICIGCTLPECSPCHIHDTDLLSAILAAIPAGARSRFQA